VASGSQVWTRGDETCRIAVLKAAFAPQGLKRSPEGKSFAALGKIVADMPPPRGSKAIANEK
jgi:hypothetical protein